MQRPTRGEMIVAVCGGSLVAASFLRLWGRYECPTCPADARWSRVSLWSEGFSVPTKVAVVLVGLLLVTIVLRVVGMKLPWPEGRIYVGIGSLVTVTFVLALVSGPSDLGFGHTRLLEVSRGPLLSIAWLVALVMLYGGLVHMRQTMRRQRRAPGPGPVVLR